MYGAVQILAGPAVTVAGAIASWRCLFNACRYCIEPSRKRSEPIRNQPRCPRANARHQPPYCAKPAVIAAASSRSPRDRARSEPHARSASLDGSNAERRTRDTRTAARRSWGRTGTSPDCAGPTSCGRVGPGSARLGDDAAFGSSLTSNSGLRPRYRPSVAAKNDSAVTSPLVIATISGSSRHDGACLPRRKRETEERSIPSWAAAWSSETPWAAIHSASVMCGNVHITHYDCKRILCAQRQRRGGLNGA